MRKKLTILLLVVIFGCPVLAQNSDNEFKISLQTDLLAYTTKNGYSAWGVAKHGQNKLALAYINYPNRSTDVAGVQENMRFVRLQLSRHFNPSSKLRNFYYGINIEHHWRELEEDDNPDEVLNDTRWEGGLFIGYEWQPWKKKDNALKNISIIPWLGANYVFDGGGQTRVFENTGTIYSNTSTIRRTQGINISYTIFSRN